MGKLRIGCVGIGGMGNMHLRGYAGDDRVQVVAICDILESRMAEGKANHHLGDEVHCYTDFKEMIEKENLDVVDIATPNDFHSVIAVYALEHGCHVMGEKPMAPSLQECDEMIEAAKRTGNKLEVVAQSRCLTPIYRTKRLIESGIAGKLLYTQINSFWYRGRSYYDLAWRGQWASEGGGCTFVHAVHHIDLLAWMAGMPSQVSAMIGNVAHTNSEEEDLSMAMLRYPNGSFAQLSANLVCHGQNQALTFACEKANLEIPHAFSADTPLENGFPKENTEFLQELNAYLLQQSVLISFRTRYFYNSQNF